MKENKQAMNNDECSKGILILRLSIVKGQVIPFISVNESTTRYGDLPIISAYK